LASNRAEQKAYYRFLKHPKLTEGLLIREAADRLKSLVKGRHVLCIQDTSEINLTAHDGRISDKNGLGRLDYASYALGFKIHPVFVLDAYQLTPLGFADIKLWHRPLEMPTRMERDYRRHSIEEKESYKWIEVSTRSKESLKQATLVTFIQDREADIYEVFTEVPDKTHHLIIRSSSDRTLPNGIHLSETLAALPLAGYHTICLCTDHRTGRSKTTVALEIRFCKVRIRKPNSSHMKGCPAYKELYAVEAKQSGTKNQAEKIYWRLLTTHKVEDLNSALQIINWYSCRWHIEQLFRLLKHKGFQIEQTELESGAAIRKLTIIMLTAILKIIQMRLAYSDENEGQPIEEVYNKEEINCLRLLNKKLQGKTIKQRNSYNPKKTKWATWILARLGGWKGYTSQGPPGIITLKRGLERFTLILEGMLLAKEMGTR